MQLERRFWSKVAVVGNVCECWPWIAGLDVYGYGVFQLGARTTRKAHRVAFELTFGRIPDGLVLDHLCSNRACVNPHHLDPVTNRENIRRGDAGWHSRTTECPRGHRYDDANTYFSGGKRYCRACNRESHARRKAAAQVRRCL